MEVKIKKLHRDAIVPSYAKYGDAGLDLSAVDVSYKDDYISYKTGLAFEIPKGYVGLLFPRSSNSKKDLILCNSVGVLDSGYRGEVEFRYKLVYNGGASRGLQNIYSIGDRVGQIIIIPYPEITFIEKEELEDSERGSDGFGSTDLK